MPSNAPALAAGFVSGGSAQARAWRSWGQSPKATHNSSRRSR